MEHLSQVASARAHIIFIFCAFLIIILISETYQVPPLAPVLYTDHDNVLILNQNNFADLIYDKDRAYIIEFYNSYCGHCQRFAPTWIEFAGDIKHWETVVAPAVLDCSVAINLQLCQNYDIPAYPTVKHFWTHLTDKDLGTSVPVDRNVDSIRHNLIDFLTQKARDKGTSNHWPMILPVSGTTLTGIWKDLPKEISSFFLVIEESESYTGREVILDFSGTEARILRMEDTSANQIDDLPEIPSYPALVLLSRNTSPKLLLLASSNSNPRSNFRSAIEKATGIVLEPSADSGKNKSGNKGEMDDSTKANTTLPVQMVDLENALHNMLMQEVPVNKELSGKKLSAFLSFLDALTKTFPGRFQVTNFLRNLYDWALQQGDVIKSNDMIHFIQGSQTSDAFLPDMTDWVGCKGSSPKYRGFPCSLWTLFHTLTVQSYTNYLKGEASQPRQVLQAIHNYVYNFFGCSECAEHFHSMAVNLDSEAQHPNDTVLWLWRGHNKVNQRLHGDATEDPDHPKIQFPPDSLCKQCRKSTNSDATDWNVEMILSFLMNFYGKQQISLRGVVPFNSKRQQRSESNKSPSLGWNFRYFSGLDISLCVLLYVFSVVLLTVVFLVFRFRRHRLKRKHGYSLKQLP